jgi:two-component sensor histidine kinase
MEVVIAMLTLDKPEPATDAPSHFYRKEAEHRIANSLQLISALVRQRARNGDVSDPQTFLLEIADRIETVGKLHRFLGESSTGTVQLRKYLEEICNRLRGALSPTSTSFSFDCPTNCQLPAKKALSLGLITAELISNSLKYAHPAGLPTRISLSCSCEEEGRLMIAYEDDGVGFPEGFDVNAAGHMGMNFIRLLSTGLEGHHEWHSDPLGMRFEIVLPVSA